MNSPDVDTVTTDTDEVIAVRVASTDSQLDQVQVDPDADAEDPAVSDESQRQLLELWWDLLRNVRLESRVAIEDFLRADQLNLGGVLILQGRYERKDARIRRRKVEAGYSSEGFMRLHGLM